MTNVSTQLTTTDRNLPTPAPESPHMTIEGLEGLTQRDIILPRWSIVQPTSRFDGADEHVGQFHRNIDGEYRESLVVVPLKIDATRLLWSGDREDKAPECVSRDTITGSVYGSCAACQFNRFANPDLDARLKGGDKTAKHCNYGYTLIVIDDLIEFTPALLGAMGTSVRPIKVAISQIVAKRRPPFSCVMELGLTRMVTDDGKFFVMKPSLSWLGEEETAMYRELWRQYSGVTIREVDEVVGEDTDEGALF